MLQAIKFFKSVLLDCRYYTIALWWLWWGYHGIDKKVAKEKG